jgi:hypothetical protein
VVPRQTITRYGDRWLKAQPLPVSGAFQLEAWRINDKIRLRKNPRYWDAAQTALECVDLLPIGSAATALNLQQLPLLRSMRKGGARVVPWNPRVQSMQRLMMLGMARRR